MRLEQVLNHCVCRILQSMVWYDKGVVNAQDMRLQEITSNRWKSEPWVIKTPKYAYMQARGPACFDLGFYRSRNQDLQNLTDDAALWDHWLNLGEFEGRPHR